MAGNSRGADDPRFSKVFSDPRFRSVKKKDLKVQLDDRFNKKELKKEFTLLKSNAKVDKYGRKVKGDDVVDNLDKYYEDEEEEEEEEEEGEEEEEEEEEESKLDSDSDSESELDTEDPLAKARGMVESDSSEEEEVEIDSDIDSDIESDIEVEEKIPTSDPTNRIAAVNLDWDHINSKDLYATFNSFLPMEGSIKSVTIYKSEYGKEKLADEELNGPPKEIFKAIQKENELKSDEEEEDEEDEEDIDLEKASRKLIQENNGEDEGFDSTELRKYQLQRLRYYYAVIEFNNLESSIEIYKKCDNTEFESSGNFFDLRYIPNEMEFEENDIRDKCNKLPNNYQPIEFSTDSLRNSKPKLTWDETPIERVQILSKSFKQGELDNLDLKNYLASDSEDDGEININKYKQLVGKKESHKEQEEDKDEGDVDIEFTFTPGLSNNGKNDGKDKVIEEELTPIEKLRMKEKERRKARKQKVKELKKEAHNGKKNRGKRDGDGDRDEEELQIEERGSGNKNNTSELEHFNIKDIAKLEKLKSKKNKFKNKRQRELENELEKRMESSKQDKLEVDERFSEMIDSHAFVGGSKLLQDERKRRKKSNK